MTHTSELSLSAQLRAFIAPIMTGLNYPIEHLSFRPSQIEGIDFQSEIALRLAKTLKQPPKTVAQTICDAAQEGTDSIAQFDVSGPGFINVKLNNTILAQRLNHIQHINHPNPENIMLDFGGPNVAKPMHVGHLRSAVIGDTLQRIFRFCGDTILSDIHLGDWGLQMGHIITQLEIERPDLPHLDPENIGSFPNPDFDMTTLAALYPRGASAAKADPVRMAAAQKAVSELQEGRAGYVALISYCIDISVAALKTDYAFLGVSFDLWLGERDVGSLVPEIVKHFQDAGLAYESDGALIVDIAQEGENIKTTDKAGETKIKNPMPPLMLLNSRGGSGYHATDLATISDRLSQRFPELDRIIYVVDQRQSLHFEQVFRASEKVGYITQDRLEFIGFGTVNGTDGKPFKTREGGVLQLADLHRQALEHARQKMQDTNLPEDLSDAERAHIQKCVAVAAIRFADLSNTRTTNYVFDLEKFTQFQGKTGPYLLYQAVRIKSLLRRAGEVAPILTHIDITTSSERDLALALDGFAEAVLGARHKRMPHILCEYLYDLSQKFSIFYTQNPILKAKDETTQRNRLGLATHTLNTMLTGLDLIGIEVPERM